MRTITDLRLADCRWPTAADASGGHRFICRAPVAPGRPYCLDHCRRAYRAPTPEERRLVLRRRDGRLRSLVAPERVLVAAE